MVLDSDERAKNVFKHSMVIRFPQLHASLSAESLASKISDILAVDRELRPSAVQRSARVESETIHIQFEASDVATMRVSVSSFLDCLQLSLRAAELALSSM